MTEEKNNKKIIFNIILGVAVLVWSFFILDKGFYMDESGLLELYRKTYRGSRMFLDMWDTLQMGGILIYPLFALYYEVLQPIIAPLGCGIVLFMRIAYQVIRLLIAVYLYFTIKKTKYRDNAFITSLMYYAFIISFKNFSYKSICDFGIVLFLCWAYRYFETDNKLYMVLMGLATSVTIVAYPTMILFPVIFVVFMIIMTYKGYGLGKAILVYTITCFICGALFLTYLQLTSGVYDAVMHLTYLSDKSHTGGVSARLIKMLISYLVFAAIAYAPVFILWVIGRVSYLSEKTFQIILTIYWVAFMVGIIAIRPESVSLSRFIYGCLLIFFWFPYLVYRRERSEFTTIGQYRQPDYDGRQMLGILFMVSVVAQMIWAFSTNQDIAIPGNMSVYVVLALVMIIGEELEGLKLLRVALVGITLFFMGFWIAEGDGGYSDILEHRTYVTYGAYQGIALSDSDYQMNEAAYDLVTEYVSADDYLYVPMGFSVTAYLNSDAIEAADSPYARAGKDQNRVLEYWEVNPDKVPDYILIDTSNKYYDELLEGETYQYILENYPTTVATEGNFVLLSK